MDGDDDGDLRWHGVQVGAGQIMSESVSRSKRCAALCSAQFFRVQARLWVSCDEAESSAAPTSTGERPQLADAAATAPFY